MKNSIIYFVYLIFIIVTYPTQAQSDNSSLPSNETIIVNNNNLESSLSCGGKNYNYDELVMPLLYWIAENSSLELPPNDLPIILVLDSNELFERAFENKNSPEQFHVENHSIKALYNHNTNTICMLNTLNLDSPTDRAILIHELVHYLQFINGDDKLFDCINKLESLAYRLHAKYLHENNQVIPFDSSRIREVTNCN